MSLRRIIVKLHLYLGLVALLPVVLLGATGALLTYEDELDRALNRDLFYVDSRGRLSDQALLDAARRAYPDETFTIMYVEPIPGRSTVLWGASGRDVFVDPATARVIGDRHRDRALIPFINSLHTSLATASGHLVVGSVAVVLFVSTLSGLYLWWPRGRRKVQAFRLAWAGGWRAKNYSLHKTIGLYSLPIVAVIALTGAAITFPVIASVLIHGTTEPAEDGVVTVTAAASPVVAVDEAIATARRSVPTAVPVRLALPTTPAEPLRVQMRRPREPYLNGGTNVFVDPRTGEVLSIEDPMATGTPGERVEHWILHLHTGFWGRYWSEGAAHASRLAWLAASLVVAVLAVTGLIGWMGRRRTRRTAPAARAPA